jgi:REP element-mobilizing transposase RayT
VGHPPRNPIWLRWEQSVICFVTICVKDRKRVLANDAAFTAFKNAAAKLREWRVLAAILMPDHLHVVVAPSERDARLGNFSAALKRWMREELERRGNGKPVVLIACYGQMSRFMRNGFISRKISSRRPHQRLERVAISVRV